MALRLVVLSVLISGFAIGFAELARLSARIEATSAPCAKWSTLNCRMAGAPTSPQ
ncbi:hypothetical protein [Pseudaminobacter soli (ex Li et al. 2025)]|uniref:hypothetical protein n=1 Tax=Pseudaminobacter soli (ex Li et al. 2025) TaxID=1295366 RepID=UPI0015E759E2|nr:hypothetical protein [Mesorhizobium soli]